MASFVQNGTRIQSQDRMDVFMEYTHRNKERGTPEEMERRVALYAERFEAGLDIFTGLFRRNDDESTEFDGDGQDDCETSDCGE